MSDFVRVGKSSEFREGRGRVVEVDGVRVAVFRRADGFVAVADACPHMGASLANGKLAANHLECAWHGYRFDLTTGRSGRRSGARVAVYEVKIEGKDVLLRRLDPTAEASPAGEDDDLVPWDPEPSPKRPGPSRSRED